MVLVKTFLVALLCLAPAAALAGPRLEAIQTKGHLNCGVAVDEPGMSVIGPDGTATGFEPDLCRAIATAIFGVPNVVFTPTPTLTVFIENDEIDLVIRGLTQSFRRDVAGLVHFGPVVLYNGQTFLTRADSGLRSFADLDGKTICVSSDVYADFLPALQHYFDSRSMSFMGIGTMTRRESEDRFFAGECDAVTADAVELASAVIRYGDAGAFHILEGQIEDEPLAPLLRRGDDEFLGLVTWAIHALVNAEALGVDSTNVDAMRASAVPEIAAFFAEPPEGAGFHPEWSYRIVKFVGNYGQLFHHHLGRLEAANLDRGPNRLARNGGLLYAPPVR
jgi:general L-amino acid transport system substrate-binding protein